ncbi:MAG: large conductance mechanosensitive channel [Spirosomataceae bacterium]|jgi:large conductance mechanosensitive channel
MLKEFKEFAVKGNMIDIAIGVIIGAAFNKVVDVLVKEIFLPPLSFLTDGLNLENKKFILREAQVVGDVTNVEEIAIGYGKLFETSIDFLIVSLTVFLIVKFINKLKNKADDVQDETVKTPKNIELLNKVADLLEKQNELLKK